SRELHDELGQSLTAMRIGLNFIENLPEPPPAEWREQVSRLKAIADSTVAAVQRIATDLRPPMLDVLGLARAIEWLAESGAERSGMHCDLKLPARLSDLGCELSTAIFRILQESLTNAMRHSHASSLCIELEECADVVRLRVADNGCGMEAS